MESEWEKEIRELLDSLERFSVEDLMKEIMETPLPFIDYEPTPKARRTRKKSKRSPNQRGTRRRTKLLEAQSSLELLGEED
jgi:hypothetical protein